MIIQGSNLPIVIEFDEEVENIPALEIGLYHGDDELKHWSKNNLIIDGSVISAPLKQSETINFPADSVMIEIKWLDSDGITWFADTIKSRVMSRRDRTIMEAEKDYEG